MFDSMRVLAITFMVSALAACASPQLITLKDGTQLQAADTVDFDSDSGFYEFEDPQGVAKMVNKDEIRSIEEYLSE